MEKPFAPACERNREPILAVLRAHLTAPHAAPLRVLEIGSGSGQHAVHFCAALPHVQWQCSDLADALPGIRLWLDEAALPNTLPPIALAVDAPWPAQIVDAVFTANTLHIMPWRNVETLFARLPGVLAEQGRLIIYGPFNEGGRATGPGNARFDAALRAANPQQGLRDVAAVQALAAAAGLRALDDIAMPANNRCLIWQRAG